MALISMLFGVNSFSQTINADLFQTWYLYYIGSSDTQEYFPVSAVTPSISPNLTFTEALDIYGYGACNSFTGTFSTSGISMQFDNFASTLLICGSNEQMNYEGGFFSLMQSSNAVQYYISGEGNNMVLAISTPISTHYVFRNAPLNAPNFDFKQVQVYPNPVEANIFIISQNNLIDKIEIYNSLGQNVKTINNGFDVINISNISAGIYLMKFYSEDNVFTRKIVKK